MRKSLLSWPDAYFLKMHVAIMDVLYHINLTLLSKTALKVRQNLLYLKRKPFCKLRLCTRCHAKPGIVARYWCMIEGVCLLVCLLSRTNEIGIWVF